MCQSKIGHFRRLELQLQLICNKRNKFGIRGFSLGIADGIAEKSLQRIQIASVPCHFDGVPDSTLDSGRGGLECFRHLGVKHLGDGVSLACGQQEGRLTAQRKDAKCK